MDWRGIVVAAVGAAWLGGCASIDGFDKVYDLASIPSAVPLDEDAPGADLEQEIRGSLANRAELSNAVFDSEVQPALAQLAVAGEGAQDAGGEVAAALGEVAAALSATGLQSTVVFDSEPNPGALVCYQLYGGGMLGTSRAPTNGVTETLDCGIYRVWAERAGERTSPRRLYRVIEQTLRIVVQEH